MKKYITVAALLAAGTAFANAATLLGSWNFSSATVSNNTIAATSGTADLSMTISGQTLSDGVLSFSSSGTAPASVNVSSLGIGPCSNDTSGDAWFTVSMTLTSFTMPSGSIVVLFGASDSGNQDRTGLAVDTRNSVNWTTTAWQGGTSSRGNVSNDDFGWNSVSAENPLTIDIVYTNAGAKVYSNGSLVIEDRSLYWGGGTPSVGDLTSIGFGMWASNNSGKATMSVSEISIYSGVHVIPEPSAFGLLAGAGALALVSARRRRKA